MASEAVLRDYEENDSQGLLELMRNLQGDLEPLFDRMLPAQDLGPWYREHVLKRVQDSGGRVIIADVNGEFAGYAVLLLRCTNDERPDERAHVYALVAELLVAPAYRGSGLGTRLLRRCEELARAEGVKWLRVEVLARNEGARRLYDRYGFSEHLVTSEKPL